MPNLRTTTNGLDEASRSGTLRLLPYLRYYYHSAKLFDKNGKKNHKPAVCVMALAALPVQLEELVPKARRCRGIIIYSCRAKSG